MGIFYKTEDFLAKLTSDPSLNQNKTMGAMLADLMKGPFKGKKFKFHHTDPKSGERKVMKLGGEQKAGGEQQA